MNATTPEQRAEAENVLTGTLKTLFAVSENYPDLKANQNFLELQGELRDTEDKISYMRQSYNDTVMKYNTAIQTFPAVLIAGMMGFKQRDSFDATANRFFSAPVRKPSACILPSGVGAFMTAVRALVTSSRVPLSWAA